jgi:pimeloyl-ACP methyl ester carboxylesterase
LSSTFLLLHGAWHGGWCWRKVVPLLTAAGHAVYAPSLTGLGERAAQARPEIDLDTHIDEMCALLDCEDLNHVVLVGNSYGGMVATGVADRRHHRVIHVVYLNGMIPADGQSMMDLATDAQRTLCRESVRREGDGWRLPPFAIDVFGIADPADAAWVAARLVPHPFRSMEQKLRLMHPDLDMPPRTLIYCTQRPPGNYERFIERARTAPGWRYRELATGHDSMITAPEEVATLLLEAARVVR